MVSDQTISGALNTYTESALSINTNTQNVINLNKLSSLVDSVNKLNTVVSNMYGVTAKWFRAIPVDRSKDVIFHEYTLSNVEDCGFDINVMYSDTGYDEAALQYTMMGIQYQIPLTCEISIDNWNNATNNDGSIPQKNDIVYIPQSNKLYQVVSMNPIRTVASQVTAYRCNLAIYKNKSSVLLHKDLEETINQYTDNIDKVFGNEIIDEIIDAVADKQTSPHNNTYKDKYKILYKDVEIVNDNLVFDGHVPFKNYYKNDNSYEYLSKYSIEDNKIPKTYSVTFSIDEQNNTFKLLSNGTSLKCDKCSKFIEFSYGQLSLIASHDDTLKILNEKYPSNWYNIYNLKMFNSINLLSCMSENNILSIDITPRYLILTINDDITYINLKTGLKFNNWYNISINISPNAKCTIIDMNDSFNIVGDNEFTLKMPNDLSFNTYTILGSNSKITNIRLFDDYLINNDKKIINAISQFNENESHLIIADNCDERFDKPYYGAQR